MRKNIQSIVESVRAPEAGDRLDPSPPRSDLPPQAHDPRWLLVLGAFVVGCYGSSAGIPDPSRAIDSECERVYECVADADAGLPVAASFCESEAVQLTKDREQTCDQATLDACADANATASCDNARELATKPGGLCAHCWGLQ